ncbi:hypothetical protein DBA29_26585 [Xenophilus aerolatus]|nr:hypothetical protein [Xenophilus aerolatus]
MTTETSTFLAEYLRYATSDGVHLQALLWEPRQRGDSLVILVPGRFGSFAGTHDYRPMAGKLNADGHAFMAINMRTASDFSDPTLELAVFDVGAAVAEAKRRGYTRIALFGTSLGGPRSALYLAEAADPAIKLYGLIGAIKSPYEAATHYMNEERLSRLDRTIAIARDLVAQGKPMEMVAYENLFKDSWARATARGFVNVYGSPDVTDIGLLKRAHKIKLPTAIFHGLKDEVSLPPNAQDIHDALTSAASRELFWVEGATHYLEPGWIAEEYADRVSRWVREKL